MIRCRWRYGGARLHGPVGGRRGCPRCAAGLIATRVERTAALLPSSQRMLARLRNHGALRCLKLPNIEKPFTTVGAIRALIRWAKLE